MDLSRRTFVLSAISMALFSSYQNRAFACNVEVPYDAYAHIATGVVATWGLIALDAIVAGTKITAAAAAFGLVVTAAAVVAVAVIVAIQNRDCIIAGINNLRL